MTQPIANTLIAAGLSKSMAYHVASGARQIGVPLALWLFDQDGIKVGPLQGKSAADIRALKSVHPAQAPDSVVQRRAKAAANDDASPTSEAA